MLEDDDVENIKTDSVNTVIFNVHQIKRLKFFLGHPVVAHRHVQVRLMGNFSLNGGIPWFGGNRWFSLFHLQRR